jgi:catechol 2,3-dioxygenase-like lactoylglutathione lyase family enzyme
VAADAESLVNLNTARIFVLDLAQAEAFYARTLSLPLRAGGASHGFCLFAPGSTQLIVEAVAADAPDDEQLLVGRFTGLSFAVESVEQTYRDLLAKGVRFTEAPEPQPWGGVLATFQDPAGNAFQLAQYPGAD